MDELKQDLIKALREFGECSTARLSHEVSANFYDVKEALEELEDETIVLSKAIRTRRFWRLKGESDAQEAVPTSGSIIEEREI